MSPTFLWVSKFDAKAGVFVKNINYDRQVTYNFLALEVQFRNKRTWSNLKIILALTNQLSFQVCTHNDPLRSGVNVQMQGPQDEFISCHQRVMFSQLTPNLQLQFRLLCKREYMCSRETIGPYGVGIGFGAQIMNFTRICYQNLLNPHRGRFIQ